MTKEDLSEVFIQTSRGLHFHPFDPKQEDISIYDIAHALSLVVRWNGHTAFHYSVATHALNVQSFIEKYYEDEKLQFHGLHHDDQEAYFADVPSPIKEYLPDVQRLEETISKAIAKKFKLLRPLPDPVHFADKAVLILEALSILPVQPKWLWSEKWSDTVSRILSMVRNKGIRLEFGRSPEQERQRFIAKHVELGGVV